jgi:hypothetical protein
MGVFQGIDDVARVAANGLTLGLPDYLEGEGADERTAAARERLGLAGDAVNAAAMLFGAGKIVKGVKAAPGAIKAGAHRVRMAVHPGVTRREALARLGLEAPPTLAARAVSAAKAHPFKTAGAAGALGIGTMVGNASRAPAAAQQKAARAQTPAAAPATAKAAASRKNPFDLAVERMAAQTGGVSLNELSALADVMAKTTPATRPPTTKDVVGLELKGMADEMYAANMARAQAAKAAGDINEAARLQGEAVKERQALLMSILGANPIDLQTAAEMGEAE